MKNTNYKIGDEFRLIDGFRDKGPCVKKVTFKIIGLDADGVGVSAINADAPVKDWAPMVYSIPKAAMLDHLTTKNLEWLDRCNCGDVKAKGDEHCTPCAKTYSPSKGSVRIKKAA